MESVKVSRRKAELFKQKDAFYLFKVAGYQSALHYYPEYKEFIDENKDRSMEEIEAQIDAQIRIISRQSLLAY